MKPEARVWRKTLRAASKGTPRGRRTTHKIRTQEPRRGSTWTRRHPGQTPPWIRRWLATATAPPSSGRTTPQ